MKITFQIFPEENYFISKYTGQITPEYLLESWKEFIKYSAWKPGLYEITDLSSADVTKLDGNTLATLSSYINSVYEAHAISEIKVAVYAPRDLPFGMARMYEAYANESTELVKVFRDKQKAIEWIKDTNINSD